MKLLALVLTFAVSLFVSACAPNYSEGDRTGVITKLSRKGVMFKSYEGTINQGGITQQAVANTMDFNVQDQNVVLALDSAMNSGKPVKIHYTQWLVPPLNVENDHVVVSVTQLP